MLSAVALAISLSRRKVIKETTTTMEHAPTEHPFCYNAHRKCYQLDGDLMVTGGLSCLNNKEG